MQNTAGSKRSTRIGSRPVRFVRLAAQDSNTAELLRGCPVVTSEGEKIGRVDHLMVDALTHQLRYVVLARKRHGAVVAIPWHALYFDSAGGRLVFYTWN
jgi:hypothetical protein